MPVPIVALTGNIGSGKSTVARLLGERGARVIDADRLARDVVAPGEPANAEIADRFGDGVRTADGGIDRTRLGEIVFGDPEARAELEAITHPRIRRRMAEAIAAAMAADPPLIVLEIPLLFETGMDATFDRTLLVTAEDAVRRSRIQDRDGLPAGEIAKRMASQMPQAEKADRATWTIANDGGLDDLAAEVDRLWPELVGRDPQ